MCIIIKENGILDKMLSNNNNKHRTLMYSKIFRIQDKTVSTWKEKMNYLNIFNGK